MNYAFSTAYDGVLTNYADLSLESVAHSLANINRFAGHANRQVSVGAHTLHCYWIGQHAGFNNYVLQNILFHDVPECIYNDIPSYAKRELGEDAHAWMYEQDQLLLDRFNVAGIVTDEAKRVKQVDMNALTLEAMYAFDKFDPKWWPTPTLYTKTDLIELLCTYPPDVIERRLLDAFKEYTN